jgi:hypothetical protein
MGVKMVMYPVTLLSDHSYISFDTNKATSSKLMYRFSKKTDWESFKINLEEIYGTCNKIILSTLNENVIRKPFCCHVTAIVHLKWLTLMLVFHCGTNG